MAGLSAALIGPRSERQVVVTAGSFPHQHPNDGRRRQGHYLPCTVFDRDQQVTHAAIIQNKRLSDVLACINERHEPPTKQTVNGTTRRSSFNTSIKAFSQKSSGAALRPVGGDIGQHKRLNKAPACERTGVQNKIGLDKAADGISPVGERSDRDTTFPCGRSDRTPMPAAAGCLAGASQRAERPGRTPHAAATRPSATARDSRFSIKAIGRSARTCHLHFRTALKLHKPP